MNAFGGTLAKLSPFKLALQKARSPHKVVRETYGEHTVPTTWDDWSHHEHRGKFVLGYEPSLRLSEPNAADASGKKYRVTGDPAMYTLANALHAFIENGDEDAMVTVWGSGRPIVVWRTPEGVHTPTPCVFWPSASIVEATAIQASPLVKVRLREITLLRVRCRRSTKQRIEEAASYEQQLIEGRSAPSAHFGRKGNLSAFCLGAILEYCEKVERAKASAKQFTG